ncbi:MAG: hypothetical protein K2W95_00970 [Candidatus Obscuribacterales bacterium]|nr:hypothetical protein [Candidatus Obscuribacterales bacterium]
MRTKEFEDTCGDVLEIRTMTSEIRKTVVIQLNWDGGQVDDCFEFTKDQAREIAKFLLELAVLE